MKNALIISFTILLSAAALYVGIEVLAVKLINGTVIEKHGNVMTPHFSESEDE